MLLFEEAGRKVWSHTPKRRKAPALGEEGYHLVNEALCDFFLLLLLLNFLMRRSVGS